MPRKANTTGDHYNDVFPSRLRSLIEKNGTRQEELVEVLGVKARQSVTGYTDGSTMPTPDKISALAKFFNKSADFLLGLTDADVPTEEQAKRYAMEYTGLSREAVEALHKGTSAARREALGFALGNEQFLTTLSSFLWSFIPGKLAGSKYESIPTTGIPGKYYEDFMFSKIVRLLPNLGEKFQKRTEKKTDLIDDALYTFVKANLNVHEALITVGDDAICAAFGLPTMSLLPEDFDLLTEEERRSAALQTELEEDAHLDENEKAFEAWEERRELLRTMLMELAGEREVKDGNDSEENE